MEEKEAFDIFRFIIEKKIILRAAAALLFLLFASPTKVSVFFGIIFSLLGEAIRTLAISEDEGDDALIATGVYGYVRNPLCLGAFLLGVGLFVMGNIFIFTVAFIIVYLFIYTEKIKAEEELLKEKYGEEFEEYTLNVPRLFPGFIPFNKSKVNIDVNKIKAHKEYQVWLVIYAVTIIMFLKT